LTENILIILFNVKFLLLSQSINCCVVVCDKDLKLATEQQEKYFENVLGTISGTIVDFGTKKGINQNG
jgi:hypothetical protein